MTTEEIIYRQRKYFASGATRPAAARRKVLENLREGIEKYEDQILDALSMDLGKSRTEGYMTEIGMVKSELEYMNKHLDRLMKSRRVSTPAAQFAASSRVIADPYGCVLVMSPWNYPFLLSMDPLIAAVAAGNTVLLKPSAYSPATSEVLKEMIENSVTAETVSVVTGGRQVNSDLLDHKFDYIFFTGSKAVGQLVMEKASRWLTPVTLELGGKSPCIVDETAKIPLAARRIVFGKYLNLGQTCVAPDYILVQESVKDRLIACLQKEIRRQYGAEPLKNPDYGHIVNKKHYDRLCSLTEGEKILSPQGSMQLKNPDTLQIAPLILEATPDSKCMQEEIFGPVLPVLTYRTRGEAVRFVDSRPRPLALYLFTEDKKWAAEAMRKMRFGGGCVNDTVVQLASEDLPFGGVGESGMGSCHGRYGFDTFTHYKGMMDKKTWFDMPVRYQPYSKMKNELIRAFMH